jgi:ribosomal protein S18 acetylase RimI-like enzyme
VSPEVRQARDTDVDALVELTLLTFVPVFDSFLKLLGPAIFETIWPDWRQSQRQAVEDLLCDASDSVVLVAELNNVPVGFVAYEVRPEGDTGEILLLAVHPDHQSRGIGTLLNERALDGMKRAGVKLAIVDTGGESSHAPARRSYEKAGFTALPLVRHFKKL